MANSNRLSRLAGRVGTAVGTFEKNRMLALRGKRPAFLTSMTQEGKWRGTTDGTTQQAQRRAVTNSWVFIACSFIARQVSAADFMVLRDVAGEKDPVQIPGHPLEKILRRPNPWMGGSFLWEYTAWWLELNGNGYWFLGLGRDGQLAEVWPMPAEAVEPFPGNEERFVDFYRYTVGGHAYDIPAEYVVHMKLTNPFDIFRGMSPLKAAILPADTDTFMARWNAAFFGRDNTMPSAIINLVSDDPEHPIEQTDLEALKQDLRADYHTIKRKTAITSAAKLEVEMLGWNPKDLDFIQGREFTKDEIYAIYGIPGGLLDKDATYANSANANMVFNNNTLWPLLVLLAEQLTAELVWPVYGQNQQAGFADVRQTNREAELQEIGSAGAYLTIDEIRRQFWKLDPLPDDRGVLTMEEAARGGMGTEEDSDMFGDLLAGEEEPPPGEPPAEPAGQGQALITPIPTEGEGEQQPGESAGEEVQQRIAGQDLRRWRTKAIRSVASGAPLPVGFRSDFLPDSTKQAIRAGLRTLQAVRSATTAAVVMDSVKGIFQEVKAAQDPFDGGGALKAPKGKSKRPWERLERAIYKQVRASLGQQIARLLKQIEKDGEAVLSDEGYWTRHRQTVIDSLVGGLAGITRLGVERAKSGIRRDVRDAIDWDLVNRRAEDWARRHAAELVTEVTETTKEQIRQGVGDWVSYGEALPSLRRRIEAVLSDAEGSAADLAGGIRRAMEEAGDRIPEEARKEILQAIKRAGSDVARLRKEVAEAVGGIEVPSLLDVLKPRVATPDAIRRRARLIAQTESTGAYASGNAEAWQEAGVQPAVFKPPAHPGCRCYLQPKKLPDGSWVMVWYTARDSRVCVQPTEVPWSGSKVKGCKALHRVVVSTGPMTGRKV